MEKVVPLVHVDKWTDLFSFITISHQAPELLFLDWVEKHFRGKDFPPSCGSSGAWWAITLLKQRSGGA